MRRGEMKHVMSQQIRLDVLLPLENALLREWWDSVGIGKPRDLWHSPPLRTMRLLQLQDSCLYGRDQQNPNFHGRDPLFVMGMHSTHSICDFVSREPPH